MQSILYYVHDPMCSWSWGFERTRKRLLSNLPESVLVIRLLGGLAKDSDEPMADSMKNKLQLTWKKIQKRIPGTEFNFDFWTRCQPRRSTWPACRAVLSAREQGQRYDELMTIAIQHAYYLQARNPSDDSTLIELAGELGLDQEEFTKSLNSEKTHQKLAYEMAKGRAMNATSFPSLVLHHEGNDWPISLDYNDDRTMLEQIHLIISS